MLLKKPFSHLTQKYWAHLPHQRWERSDIFILNWFWFCPGTLSPDTSSDIPTVTDNLYTAGHVASHSVAVSFQPDTQAGGVQGELTWGMNLLVIIYRISSLNAFSAFQVIPIRVNLLEASHMCACHALAWYSVSWLFCSPLTTTSPASEYWGIDQSITYGSAETAILTATAGIVDTGILSRQVWFSNLTLFHPIQVQPFS